MVMKSRIPIEVAVPAPPENQEPRAPCLALMDASESMAPRMGELLAGLDELDRKLHEDPMALRRVELAVVACGGGVKVAQEFVSASDFRPPPLVAGGLTPLGAAILESLKLIEDRRKFYEGRDLDSFKPWLFIISDGEPTDDAAVLAQASREVRALESARKLAVFAAAVEGANVEMLSELTVRPVVRLSAFDFRGMFRWLGVSLRRLSHSQPGCEEEVELPDVEDFISWKKPRQDGTP